MEREGGKYICFRHEVMHGANLGPAIPQVHDWVETLHRETPSVETIGDPLGTCTLPRYSGRNFADRWRQCFEMQAGPELV